MVRKAWWLLGCCGLTMGCSDESEKASLVCGSGTFQNGDHCEAASGARGGAEAGSTSRVSCGTGTLLEGSLCIAAGSSSAGGKSGGLGSAGVSANPATAAGAGTTSIANGGTTSPSITAGGSEVAGAQGVGGVPTIGGTTNSTGGAVVVPGGAPNTSAGATVGGGASFGGTANSTGGTTVVRGGAPSNVAGATVGGGASFGGTANSTGGTTVVPGGAPSTAAGTTVGGTLSTNGGTSSAAGSGSGGLLSAAGASSTSNGAKWLALTFKNPLTLYDMNQFPSGTPLPVGDATNGGTFSSWSPDGHSLLYATNSAGYVVQGVNDQGLTSRHWLGSIMLPVASGTRKSLWSADSMSLLVASGTSVGVIDPNVDLPVLNRLASASAKVEWAPVGTRLLYSDGAGTFITNVIAGQPQTSSSLSVSGSSSWSWAPDGSSLAVCASGNLLYVKFNGPQPTITTVTTPQVSTPTCGAVAFNKDGTRLVFVGQQQRASEDLYVSTVSSSGMGVPRPVTLSSSTALSTTIAWSNTGDFLTAVQRDDASHSVIRYVVDLSGVDPGVGIKVPTATDTNPVWASAAPQLLYRNTTTTLALFDCKTPENGLVQVVDAGAETISQFSMAPNSSVLVYGTPDRVNIVDVQTPTSPIVTHRLGQSFSENIQAFSWSSDGRFLTVSTITPGVSPPYFAAYVLRMSGSSSSAPIDPWGVASAAPTMAWQP